MSAYTGSVPEIGARPRDWMDRMACRNEDPDLFSDPATEHEARVICVIRCPVRTQCLASVKSVEAGTSRKDRDGVVAGLTHNERWRCDAAAYRSKDATPALVFTEVPRCGSYTALLRHLWLGELVDPECWSAEVRRERLNQTTLAAQRAAAAETTADPQQEQQPEPAEEKSRPEPPTKGATPHERRVYGLWSQGLSDLQIARRMAISVPQVQRARGRLGLLLSGESVRKAS
ncbi:WhiB family transcriptional regulator [Streptomyces sp. T028]|uniref:WhiB family transcriptional regulator n=1 Tax=Streptomyces sp. T028 TaxID=3394379 RepID=UPI003A85069A